VGTPSVTTDSSGIGSWIESQNEKDNGIYVLKRKNASDEDVVKELSNYLYEFIKLTRSEKIVLRSKAKFLSKKLLWKNHFPVISLHFIIEKMFIIIFF
jgi:glycogen synthase